MKKLLPIGTRVRAKHDIFWPENGFNRLVAHKGALGNIAGHTVDSQFGMYPVRWIDGTIIPVFVAPAFNASVEVVE